MRLSWQSHPCQWPLTNFWPPAGAGTNPGYPPGPGGPALPRALLAGGGGAGGGGGNYAGNFYTTMGGSGGGAVVFGSTTTIDIASTGSVSTDGNPGQVQQASAGSGGGSTVYGGWAKYVGKVTKSGKILGRK